MCYAAKKYAARDGYFSRPQAWCYRRSMLEAFGWSAAEITVACFPTEDECIDDALSAGDGFLGKPPVLTQCLIALPDEATE